MGRTTALTRSPFLGFATFGAFWGAWGAAIPRVREVAGITDGELGLALLFVGAGALPAMLLAGRALDRWGLWMTGPLLVSLALAGLVVAITAGGGLLALCAGFALVGATSGAADVALNSLAGRAEQTAGRPVITPVHATFSAVVVVATLTTGALSGAGAPLLLPFALVLLAAAAACVAVVRGLGGPWRRAREQPSPRASPRPVGAAPAASAGLSLALLTGIGALTAMGLAAENAHQSWSAVYLEDELAAPATLSALGPAVFAAVVAVTRVAVIRLDTRHARTLVLAGAASATTGAALLSLAPTLPTALAALAVAAAGTAVLFPTLLGVVSRAVPEHRRARATSTVTVVAYTGFIVGPAYVGLASDTFGLRGAMLAVAALTAALAAFVPVVLRRQRAQDDTMSRGER
ncbi:MFS transporter [Pseudokineococcus sp. 1T1Z-3]|uniref:MFS transporter n=1 Tax=Pseudokineococcus sp. 1T1Z-3 TaxID=3132745 RepID=UPI0030A239FD